jgi:hypothetical protein
VQCENAPFLLEWADALSHQYRIPRRDRWLVILLHPKSLSAKAGELHPQFQVIDF